MTKIPDINNKDNWTPSDWADYYRYEDGANVIPAKTRIKKTYVNWRQYQDKAIPDEQHEKWKSENAFDYGMAIIAGKTWNAEDPEKRNLYLILCDFDNKKAQDEFCTRNGLKKSLKEVSERIRIEQYDDDLDRCHAIFYASYPFRRKSSDVTNKTLAEKIDKNEIPAIEIKGAGEHGILYVTPSPNKNGNKRHIIGTVSLGKELWDALEQHFDNIFNKYGIPYLTNNGNDIDDNKTPINELFKEDTRIYEGHNRHEAVLRVMESLIVRNRGILSDEQIEELGEKWNRKHCIPPLDNIEMNKQWKAALIFVERNKNKSYEKYDKLKGNVYYQLSKKPTKYIIADTQSHTVIEVQLKAKGKLVDESQIELQTVECYLRRNKTYLGCIPVKVTRHKNPLAFFESSDKFSMTFIDFLGEKHTWTHKTLSEISQLLKEAGYVLNDGVEMALSALILGFKQMDMLHDDEEIEYTGFFLTKQGKLIVNNIDITEPDKEKLLDAIILLDELKEKYEGRLDLLATSIVWGMVAPVIFILKSNNYFLKWLEFYGFPNATKSNTGKIVLALDGHEEDTKYIINSSRFDTVARIGEAVDKSTFPILVDEVDLKDERVINTIKTAIESKIVRSKFMSSKSAGTSDIPSLSPAIMTSNTPPPFHEGGFMRRVITRAFSQNESRNEDDPKSIEFKEFMRLNLPRLKALGAFRNWYIINHQKEILDEKRPAPLDIGLVILKAAFAYVGKNIPEWIENDRLPENQLEESNKDNDVIVKRAFEKYIDEKFDKAISFWKSQLTAGEPIEVPKDISDRLVKLAQSKVLPDIKYTRNFEVIIRKGVLAELYNHGVTRDQLPNLRALADYMKGSYRVSHGKNVVSADKAQLTAYFDEIEESGELGGSGDPACIQQEDLTDD